MANRRPDFMYHGYTGPSNPFQSSNQSRQSMGATAQPPRSTGTYCVTPLPGSLCYDAPLQEYHFGRLICSQCRRERLFSHRTGLTSSGAQPADIQVPYVPQVSSSFIPRQHPASGQLPRPIETGNPVQMSFAMVNGASAYPGSGSDYPSRIQGSWPPSTRTQAGYPIDLVERGRHNQGGSVQGGETIASAAPVALETIPLSCDICGKMFGGDYSKGNLSRHKRQKHGDGEQTFHCKMAGCAKSFKRSDALLKHNRRSHPELGLNPPLPRR